jgi:thiol-disulfide isomerase/thioredoxin
MPAIQLRCLALVMFAGGTAAYGQQQAIEPISPEEIHAIVDANAGKVVIVNFWASWCPPCLKEFPDIVRVYDDKGAESVEVLAVSMNFADEMPDVEAFLADLEPPFPVRIASSVDDAFYEGVVSPWFGEIPITLVYDTKGELAHYHRSAVNYDQLVAEVDALLAAKSP